MIWYMNEWEKEKEKREEKYGVDDTDCTSGVYVARGAFFSSFSVKIETTLAQLHRQKIGTSGFSFLFYFFMGQFFHRVKCETCF